MPIRQEILVKPIAYDVRLPFSRDIFCRKPSQRMVLRMFLMPISCKIARFALYLHRKDTIFCGIICKIHGKNLFFHGSFCRHCRCPALRGRYCSWTLRKLSCQRQPILAEEGHTLRTAARPRGTYCQSACRRREGKILKIIVTIL